MLLHEDPDIEGKLERSLTSTTVLASESAARVPRPPTLTHFFNRTVRRRIMSDRSIKQLEKLMHHEAQRDEKNIHRAEKDFKRVEKAYNQSLRVRRPIYVRQYNSVA